MGSLWIAAGVEPKKDEYGSARIPGLAYEGGVQDHRDRFLAKRPGLKLAYDTLNEVALERIDKLPANLRKDVLYFLVKDEDTDWFPDYDGSPAETYFEQCKPDRSELLSLCNAAIKRIEKL